VPKKNEGTETIPVAPIIASEPVSEAPKSEELTKLVDQVIAEIARLAEVARMVKKEAV
jgi:hypothetical protein